VGLRVRVPPEAWMSVVSGVCCLRYELIPRPEESYRVCVCVCVRACVCVSLSVISSNSNSVYLQCVGRKVRLKKNERKKEEKTVRRGQDKNRSSICVSRFQDIMTPEYKSLQRSMYIIYSKEVSLFSAPPPPPPTPQISPFIPR